MNYKKPIFIHIPTKAIERFGSLDHSGMKKDYFYYIIYRVINLQHYQNRNKNKKEVYIYIDKKKLASLTNSRIGSYIKLLVDGDILQSTKYINGIKSKNYRFNPELLGGITRISIGGSMVDNFMSSKGNDNKRLSLMKPHLKTMYKMFRVIDFDYNAMRDYANSNYHGAKLLYALNSIEQLQDKRFRRFKINKANGRLNTNLTNLPKELRQFIRGDFIEIDIKNSQFFLLGFIINLGVSIAKGNSDCHTLPYCLSLNFKNRVLDTVIARISMYSKKLPKSKELKKGNVFDFLQVTKKGVFYEAILERMNLGIEHRNRIKKESLAAIYSANEEPNGGTYFKEMKKILSKTFPEVYQLITEVKRMHYKNLSISMQILESHLFIEKIASQLIEKGIIVFTIHDSVIIPSEHAQAVKKIMEATFKNELGVIPTFNINHFKQ